MAILAMKITGRMPVPSPVGASGAGPGPNAVRPYSPDPQPGRDRHHISWFFLLLADFMPKQVLSLPT